MNKGQTQIMPDGTLVPVVTLRDHFAMAALARAMPSTGQVDAFNVAHTAYKVADAMLEEREK